MVEELEARDKAVEQVSQKLWRSQKELESTKKRLEEQKTATRRVQNALDMESLRQVRAVCKHRTTLTL